MAAIIAVAVLGAFESFWRWNGYRPTIVGDNDLWSLERERVETAGPDTVVLLGVSRLRQGFVREAFEAVSPGYSIIQLSRFNSNPVSILRDIAERTEFAGVIVCSLTASHLLKEMWDAPMELTAYYHGEWNLNKKLNRIVRSRLENTFVFLHPDLTLQYAVPDILRGNWPLQWIWTYRDRTQFVDYSKPDVVAFARSRAATHLSQIEHQIGLESYANWPDEANFSQIESWVDDVEGRGGKVVFLRCVSSGVFWELDEEHFLRKNYWDVFAASTSAETVHFKDIPETASMVCAEGSHLFYKDATIFTRALARLLQARGVLRQ